MEVKPVRVHHGLSGNEKGINTEDLSETLAMYFSTTWTFGHQKLETVIWKLHQKKNEHVKFAEAIYHDKRFVGHAPKNLSKPFYHFLSLQSCSISCEVTGK